MTSNSDYTIYCYSALEIIWISISPLIVIWDAGYVFLRPSSLPGGSLQTIWKPYSVYGAVDHLYGLPGFNKMDGILPAFATLNLVESILYLWSAYKVLKLSKAMPALNYQLPLFQCRYIPGRTGFQVALLIFAASVSVCMKTVLYALIELNSGFRHVRHNEYITLLLLWIIPNVPWILVPASIIIRMIRELPKKQDVLSSNQTKKEI